MSSSASRSDETARSGSWFGRLRSDALAGLINAVVSVPSGMATAALAGVNLVYGLYARLRRAAARRPDAAARGYNDAAHPADAHSYRRGGRPERTPALERQVRLLLDIVEHRNDLHAEDLALVRAVSSAETDPADHSSSSPHHADG